mmetsp:Transcript_4925/g.11053  ORF Transcript_4925/g.11053 Transcript_4925/m.11053 type:complete len:391 (+) Transcript_4925:2922-4094(+)
MDFLDAQSLLVHGLGNSVDTTIGRDRQLLLQVFHRLESIMRLESRNGWIHHTQGLLERFFHGTSNTHNFTNGLHCRTDFTADVLEFGHIPTRDLGDDVIQTWLECSLGLLRDGIDDLSHRNTETQLRGDEGKRVSGCLGSQSRRSGKTGVHLNNTVLERFGVKSVLDVTFSNNTKMADSSDSSVTEHVVFFVRKSLRRGHDHTVSGVDSKRVEILHVTDGHTIVVSVTDNFVFNFLPSLHASFDQNLGRCRQGFLGHISEVVFVVTHTTSETSKSKCGTNHEGVSNVLCGFDSFIDGIDGIRFGDFFVNLVQTVRKELSVFCVDNNVDRGSEDFNVVLVESSGFVHLNGAVEGSLSTHRYNDTVGFLLLDDLFDEFGCDREEKCVVGHKL